MPPACRLLVIDIDGTLVDRHGNISPQDREALLEVRRSGRAVTLSTGRAVPACRGIIKQLALDGCHIFFDGALVSDPALGWEVYARPVDRPTVIEMIEYARHRNIYLELFTATAFFIERETWATEIRRRFFDLEPTMVNFEDILSSEKVIKAQIITASTEEAAAAKKFCEHFDGRLSFSWAKTPAYPDVDFINVVDPEVSKGRALLALTTHLGIDLTEVMAIGDGLNDIPLLSIAGLAVAMQNAPDEVREVADDITPDVDHNGVATAVKKYLL